MAAVLKASVNAFALLDSDDPGNTRLADLGAQAKATDAAAAKRRPRKFHKKQEPLQMSAWKKNKLKAEAEAAAKIKQQQLLAAYTNTNTNAAGRNRRPQRPAVPSGVQFTTAANFGNNRKPQQPPAVPSRAPVMATATVGNNRKPQQEVQERTVPSRAQANAAMNMKPKQQPAAAAEAHANTATASAADDELFQQPPPARGNLLDQLFAYANSFRAFIYGNRKQNGPASAKNGGVAGVAPTDNKKGGCRPA